MASVLETQVQRRLTTEFIQADPKEIRLERRSLNRTGSGGYERGLPLSVPPQVMRLIPANRQLNERETSNGTKVVADLTLLAEHDADLSRWDEFVDQGITYQVVWVHEKRVYSTKAEVITLRGNL